MIKPTTATSLPRAYNNLNISDEEERAIAQRLKALDDAFKKDVFAKYKIQLMFGSNRSRNNPIKGLITWWRSNLAFHGGGDISIYMCPGKKLGESDCDKFMLVEAHDGEIIHCHSCGTTWRSDVCIDAQYACLSLDKWADLLVFYFKEFESNADIVLKYAPDDIRSMTRKDIEGKKYGELLDSARVKRERARAVYPLRNIMKDVSTGASLRARIYSFLTA